MEKEPKFYTLELQGNYLQWNKKSNFYLQGNNSLKKSQLFFSRFTIIL